jgi:hypothetical protein
MPKAIEEKHALARTNVNATLYRLPHSEHQFYLTMYVPPSATSRWDIGAQETVLFRPSVKGQGYIFDYNPSGTETSGDRDRLDSSNS